MEKETIYTLKFNTADFEKKAGEVDAQIIELIKKQVDLDTSTKEGAEAYKKNAKELTVLGSQLKLVNKVLDENSSTTKKVADTVNFSNNSIVTNRELLKSQLREYINLDKPTKIQTENLKKLTDTLKSQEGAISINNRNVGNYSGSLQSLAKGVGGAAGAQLGLNSAISSNPIGLLLLILTPLIKSFLTFEPLLDKVEQGMAAVNSVVSAITGSFTGFFSAISSGKGIFESLSLSFSDIGTKIKDVSKASIDLTKRQQDLDDANSQALITNQERINAIAILEKSFKDSSKTQKERISIINQITAVEKEGIKLELANAVETEKIALAKFNQVKKENKDIGESLRIFSEAKSERLRIEGGTAILEEKNQSRKNQLFEKERENQEKAVTARENRLAKEQVLEEKKLKTLEDNAKKELEILKNLRQSEIEFTNQVTDEIASRELVKLKEKLVNKELTEQEFAIRNDEVQLLRLQNQLLDLEFFEQSATDIKNKQLEIDNFILDKKIGNINKESDARKKANETLKTNNAAASAIVNKTVNDVTGIINRSINEQGDFFVNASKSTANALLDILEKQLSNAVNAAVVSAFANDVGKLGLAGIVTGTLAGVAIKALFSQIKGKFINGFATGGLISSGFPITRDNGDDVLITAQRGEAVINPVQIRRLGGNAALARAGVPGFVTGGLVTDNLSSIRNSSTITNQNQSEIKVFLSVEEYERVKNNVTVMENFANL